MKVIHQNTTEEVQVDEVIEVVSPDYCSYAQTLREEKGILPERGHVVNCSYCIVDCLIQQAQAEGWEALTQQQANRFTQVMVAITITGDETRFPMLRGFIAYLAQDAKLRMQFVSALLKEQAELAARSAP